MRMGAPGRVFAILLCLAPLYTARADERAAAKVYDELRASGRLEAFLRAFPKGGDLHNHLGGGVGPEKWIEIAIKHGFCVDERLLILAEKLEASCPAGTAPAETLRNGGEVYNRFVNAMTLRGKKNAHDYFFQQIFGRIRTSSEPIRRQLSGNLIESVGAIGQFPNRAYRRNSSMWIGAAAQTSPTPFLRNDH